MRGDNNAKFKYRLDYDKENVREKITASKENLPQVTNNSYIVPEMQKKLLLNK